VRGLDVEAFRVRYGAWPRGITRRLRFLAMRVLCYLLNVDYAQGILIIGRKKARVETVPEKAEKEHR